MWYYMMKYSFDSDKPVFGPFETEEEAYEKMQIAAQKEYSIDVNDCEFNTDIYVDSEAGEITITNYFETGNDITEFFTFEI